MSEYRYWSDEEIRTLLDIRRSGKAIKTQMHLLPGRTVNSAHHVLRKLPKETVKRPECFSWVWSAACALLADRPGLTVHQICERLGCSYRHAFDLLKENHESENRSVYISGWEKHGVNQIPQWSIGDKEDAPKLPLKTREEKLATARSRYQKKRITRGRFNPFAAAAGLVTIPEGQRGRVFQQSMKLSDFDEELAA